MDEVSDNPKVHFIAVNGVDHFAILRPTNEFIAKKIAADTGTTCNISISEEEVNQANSR